MIPKVIKTVSEMLVTKAAQIDPFRKRSVVDLYSGAGGMSYGFHQHPMFRIVAALDVEFGKPSDGHGFIECNKTYEANMGIRPIAADLSEISPHELGAVVQRATGGKQLDILLACPPCTGFSRAQAKNHIIDDFRNNLVPKTALFAKELQPDIIVMENARELIRGRFAQHFHNLKSALEEMGYNVKGDVYRLDQFGLPQIRERSIIIAAKKHFEIKTLSDMWRGYIVSDNAKTVRNAIGHLSRLDAGASKHEDPLHVSTRVSLGDPSNRIAAIPHDGGSWADLLKNENTKKYLIPSMWQAVKNGRMNSYCDIYGRMFWDRPAPTIKRECCHPGNGRYLHPEQDRLCTVREISILQGFPDKYLFVAKSRKNMYRHIGDAVPPFISYQLANVVSWIMTGIKPQMSEILLPGTHLNPCNVISDQASLPLFAAE